MYPNRRPSTRWLLVPIAAASIIAIVVGIGLYFASTGIYPYYWWFPFPFFPLVLIPAFILIFFGLRFFFLGCWGPYAGRFYDPAITTLRERYAKGEITKDQLEQMTHDLEQGE
jgi:uncharacterized membrane protein